jgi:hypothetical protein
MRPDVAARAVDINRPGVQGIDMESPVAQQYKLQGGVPEVQLYGPDGKLLAEGRTGMIQLMATMQADLE